MLTEMSSTTICRDLFTVKIASLIPYSNLLSNKIEIAY